MLLPMVLQLDSLKDNMMQSTGSIDSIFTGHRAFVTQKLTKRHRIRVPKELKAISHALKEAEPF